MKLNFIYNLLICICLASCAKNTPDTLTLEGEIDGLSDSTMLMLSYLTLNNDKWIEIEDTTYIINGKFRFISNIDELTAAYLRFDNTNVRLYLEPVSMMLELNKNRPWEYKLSGTNVESENIALKEKLKFKEEELHKEMSIAYNTIEQIKLQNGNTSERDSLINFMKNNTAKRIAIGRQMDKIRLNYVLEHRTSRIAPDLIYLVAKRCSIGIDTIKAAYKDLPENSKTTLMGKLASKQIEQTEKLINRKNIMSGSIAPDFEGIDISGKKIQLSELYKENYVLLDFWASWCKPCLEEIPKIKKIKKSYANKRLKIISISSDENKEQWESAIGKYELDDWTQILSKADSDNNYFSNDISDIYGVEYIPHYFLIDSQGKVVARWKHLGEEEVLFLENLLSNQK